MVRLNLPALALTSLLVLLTAAAAEAAELHTGMLRYPDVSATQVVFVYDNDVWIAPRSGGAAVPLSSPAGQESFPRFSPDGTKIAYTAAYDGNPDVYELPVTGGVPKRLTVQPYGARVVEYSPDGRVVFAIWDPGTTQEVELWYADPDCGLPTRMPCRYGDLASFSADGQWMAFTPYRHIWQDDSWDRYTGGQAADVWTFNLTTHESRQLTDWAGTDDVPMVCGGRVYYLSDMGPEHRRNIWSCALDGTDKRQVTSFTDAEVRWPACGPLDIVFQNGGKLWRLPLDTLVPVELSISLAGDRPNARPSVLTLEGPPEAASISPMAKRVAIEKRGDIWTIPAREGYPLCLTPTDGAAEREPAWSPDGKSVAYISDASGHYEIYTQPADGSGEAKQITHESPLRMGDLVWSPDSSWIAYQDLSAAYYVVNVAEGKSRKIASDPYGWPGEAPAWSADSRWLAFCLADEKSTNNVVHVYNVEKGEDHSVTAPAFDCYSPAFDLSGDFLYFTSSQSLRPVYSDVDEYDTFLFANSTLLACLPLRLDVKSPFLARSDEEPGEENAKEGEAGDDEAGSAADDDKASDDEAAADEAPKAKPVEIDFEGISARAIPLPVPAGRFGNLRGGDRKLFYLSLPRTGSLDTEAELKLFDLAIAAAGDEAAAAELALEEAPEDEGEEYSRRAAPPAVGDISLLAGVSAFQLTPDAASLLLVAAGGLYVTAAAPGAALDKPVPLPALRKPLDPYNEWRQMIIEDYRSFKEEFYDPNLHGVDWDGARDRALAMLPYVSCREDMAFLISEMNAELNVGHAYVWASPTDYIAGSGLGLLGCDFERASDSQGRPGIRISRIYRGADWELNASGPLSAPGIDVKAGSFLLAVNGVAVDPARTPYSLLLGSAGSTVKLTLGDSAVRDESSRDVLVVPSGYDGELRHLNWVEANRRYVYEKSGGRVGYIHVRDTQDGGIIDLQRQFLGQHNMDALIIDERYNGGGFVADRFIELLNRPVRIYDIQHFGKPSRYPRRSAQGAKVMLINQYAGSGGDGFPWLFRQSGLGKIVGVRTWGGWVSISPRSLLDGTAYVVPVTHGYEPDGSWMIEGYGVDPDIVQVNDPASLAEGRDLQLDKAIETALAEADAKPWRDPPPPPYVDRSGMGTQPGER